MIRYMETLLTIWEKAVEVRPPKEKGQENLTQTALAEWAVKAFTGLYN